MKLLVVVELRAFEIFATIFEELVRVQIANASLEIVRAYLSIFININHVRVLRQFVHAPFLVNLLI